jgi:Neuraminidase (sialidase)
MRLFRTVVVAVLLGSFFSPALASAKTESRVSPAEARPLAAATLALAKSTALAVNAPAGEAQQYGQREQQSQSQGVQDFRGGAVYVYFGSGLVLVLIIILLILL